MRKFLRQCGIVFIAMVAVDVAFALYITAVARQENLIAGGWASMIVLCNAFVVVGFVNDRRLVVPCALGAFAGTMLAMAYV